MGSYFLSSSALHPTTNMKFLVLATCVAVSSAQGFYGLQSHPNGAVTPIDEPAVAAARADHLATKFGAGLGYAGYAPGYAAGYGYAGYGAGYGYAGLGYAAAAPLVAAAPLATGYAGYGAGYGYAAAPVATGYAGYAPAYAGAYGYAGPLNLNTQLITHPNGAVVPLDEPAVAAARAAHLDTQAAEYAAAAPVIAAAPAVAAVPAVAAEPAVAAARADHLATKGVYGGVYAAAGPVAYAAGYAPYAGLVAHPNGAVVPVDEPAVAAARADHLAAHGY